MVMKKLIVFSVVFALVAGAAFAVDLGGNVIGTVTFLEGSNLKDANDDPTPMSASGILNRIRLEGSGENDDGTFGAWVRFQPSWDGGSPDYGKDSQAWGYAWWKPIDLLKIMIGGNAGDGFYGKEGVTGWGFYQTASDTGVVNPNSVWGSTDSYYTYDAYGAGEVDFGFIYRNAFYGGYGDAGLHLTVSPVDMVDINIVVPYWRNAEAQYVYKYTVAQVDLKMDFGNIALTYVGNENKLDYAGDACDPATFFLYFGLTSIENLGIDVGIGFPLPLKDDETDGVTYTVVSPISAGLGVKYTTGSFGIKARLAAGFGGSISAEYDSGTSPDPNKIPLKLLADILPFYNVSDTLRIFFSAGLGITGATEKNEKALTPVPADIDAIVGWHINPYVEVGAEWGPKFLAGIQIWSAGIEKTANDGDSALVKWAIPLAMHIGF